MAELTIPLTEKLKSIPEIFGIRLNEEPNYQVLAQDRNFEVRRYSNQLIARITLSGLPFDDFRETAFKRLGAYIFGENASKENVSMTSPVLQQHGDGTQSSEQIAMTSPVLQREESENTWTMSFILPSKYQLATAPKPLDSAIHLEEVFGYNAAVVSYTGNNSLEKIRAHEEELSDWLLTQPQLQTVGDFFAAQYDAPFVIPIFKKNEIQIRVVENTFQS